MISSLSANFVHAEASFTEADLRDYIKKIENLTRPNYVAPINFESEVNKLIIPNKLKEKCKNYNGEVEIVWRGSENYLENHFHKTYAQISVLNIYRGQSQNCIPRGFGYYYSIYTRNQSNEVTHLFGNFAPLTDFWKNHILRKRNIMGSFSKSNQKSSPIPVPNGYVFRYSSNEHSWTLNHFSIFPYTPTFQALKFDYIMTAKENREIVILEDPYLDAIDGNHIVPVNVDRAYFNNKEIFGLY